MAWNFKKIKSRLMDYFKSKKIDYEFNENENKFRFELCLLEAGIILYPYLKVSGDNIVSFNINVSKSEVLKQDLINEFNNKSKLIKAYLSYDKTVCLEYQFLMSDALDETLDLLLEQIFILQKDIDLL